MIPRTGTEYNLCRNFSRPLFKVGIQKRHQIFDYGDRIITFGTVIIERKFGVFALGKFALGAAVYLHKRAGVAVARQFKAQNVEKLYMNGQA